MDIPKIHAVIYNPEKRGVEVEGSCEVSVVCPAGDYTEFEVYTPDGRFFRGKKKELIANVHKFASLEMLYAFGETRKAAYKHLLAGLQEEHDRIQKNLSNVEIGIRNVMNSRDE